MMYEHIVSSMKEIYEPMDASFVERHLAVQFNIWGEGHGALYMEFRDGHIYVEPFEYYDRDTLITTDADTLLGIAKGRIDPCAYGDLYVEGDRYALDVLRKLTYKPEKQEKKAEKPAPKKTAGKKAGQKKRSGKKTPSVESVADRVIERAEDAAEVVKSKAEDAAEVVKSKAEDAAEVVKNKAGDAAGAVKSKAGDAAGAVKKKAGDAAEIVKEKAGTAADKVKRKRKGIHR